VGVVIEGESRGAAGALALARDIVAPRFVLLNGVFRFANCEALIALRGVINVRLWCSMEADAFLQVAAASKFFGCFRGGYFLDIEVPEILDRGGRNCRRGAQGHGVPGSRGHH
jgi:hypothetical protein